MSSRLPISFAQTAGGLTVPYTVSGAGFPFVHMSWPCGTIDTRGEGVLWERSIEERFLRITYDARGTGMGQRDLCDYTVENSVAEVEAVVDAASAGQFVLFGAFSASVGALRYAVDRPERVSALILLDPSVPGDDGRLRIRPGILALAREDWDLCLRNVSLSDHYLTTPQEAEDDLECLHRNVHQRDFVTRLEALQRWEVGDWIGRIRVPTLIVLSRSRSPEHAQRAYADRIPGATLTMLPALGPGPYGPQREPMLRVLESFLARRGIPVGGCGEGLRVMQGTRERPAADETLSPREREVLRLIGAGGTNKQIAVALGISPFTVGRHVSNIFEKTNTGSRAEVTAWGFRHGWS